MKLIKKIKELLSPKRKQLTAEQLAECRRQAEKAFKNTLKTLEHKNIDDFRAIGATDNDLDYMIKTTLYK